MSFDPAILGFPVQVGSVVHELKKLWETEGQTKTRASLVNFAVYSRGTEQLLANTQLLSELVRDHSCRAILLADCPEATPPKISAWIQAHCHLTKAGAKQVCSEQVTLLAEGVSPEVVANALMADLDYDLPLFLWWQPDFPQSPAPAIWPWVDRLLFDSAQWRNPAEQLHRLHLIKAQASARITLSDLNWTRSLALRQAVAQCADRHAFREALPHLHRIEIHHQPGAESTAALFAFWLGAQLHWTLIDHSPHLLSFQSARQTPIACQLVADPSGPLFPSLLLASHDVSLRLTHPPGSALLHSQLQSPEGSWESHFASGSQTLVSLLSEEMNPGAHHRVYLKALALWQTTF